MKVCHHTDFKDFYTNPANNFMEQCRGEASRFIPAGRRLVPDRHVIPVKSGVTLLCYPENEEMKLLFIRRTKDNGVHSGQIAFPGGRFDLNAGDTNTCDTALRETYEEIGVVVKKNQILKYMTPLYVPPSNYQIDPYLAFVDEIPVMIPNLAEVDEIITLPLSKLIMESSVSESEFETLHGKITAQYYIVDNVKIWGATAIILSELVCLEKIRKECLKER